MFFLQFFLVGKDRTFQEYNVVFAHMLEKEEFCMDTSRDDRTQHVRSAKNWLEKAEQSFGRQSDIKGELNLMLAEAEMKNLRQNHAAGRKLFRAGALGMALVIAIVGAGALQLYRMPGVAPVMKAETVVMPGRSLSGPEWVKTPPLQYDGEEKNVAPRPTSSVQTSSEAVVTAPVVQAQPEAREAAAEAEPVQEASTARTVAVSSRPVMTDRQVQEVVQDARHSLRGK